MKKKGALIVLITFILVLFLMSFWKDRLTMLSSPILYLFKNAKNIDMVAKIIEYSILFVVYFAFGSTVYIVLIDYTDTVIKQLVFSILFSMAIIVFSMMISSFFENINYIKYIFRFIFTILGVIFSLLILRK